jgi:hypothetical protein
MSDDGDGRDRRRHARGPAPVAATLIIGSAVPVARVIDVSIGGVLLELPMGIEPPRLGASGTAQLTRGPSILERHARVVRVRWRGREKGKQLPPAVALAFDDADLEAARRWERMIWTQP